MNRITLITLGVADLAASRAFYEGLGWVSGESAPGVVFFDCDGYKLGLFGHDALAAEQGRDPATLGRGAMTLSVNWPSAQAVDDAFAAALAGGAVPVTAPEATAWGGYSGYWHDPDGHVWEYAFNPFWPLDDAGRVAQ